MFFNPTKIFTWVHFESAQNIFINYLPPKKNQVDENTKPQVVELFQGSEYKNKNLIKTKKVER